MTEEPTESGRVLVKEERWSKIYQVGDYASVYESKFSTGELSISLEELIGEWGSWSAGERLDFIRAYNSKWPVTKEDYRIIDFLLLQQDEHILAMATIIATHHPDKAKIIRFLLDHLRCEAADRPNFIQALGLLGDTRAIPYLLKEYQEYLDMVTMSPATTKPEVAHNLVVTCVALNRLTGDPKYHRDLERLLNHQNSYVRDYARASLAVHNAAGPSCSPKSEPN